MLVYLILKRVFAFSKPNFATDDLNLFKKKTFFPSYVI